MRRKKNIAIVLYYFKINYLAQKLVIVLVIYCKSAINRFYNCN